MFVALGDSMTVGMGDRMPDGGWRGWAALLAGALEAPLHNLADSGALTGDVAERQLPRALAVGPELAAVIVGVNDTLRSNFDVERIGRRMDLVLGELRASGAEVLTARLPDPGRMFGLPGVLARPLARRMRAVNAVADAMAVRHRTVHLDLAGHPSTYDRRMWSVDRLHPSERGHRFLAGEYFDRLAVRLGVPVGRRPDAEPANPEPTVWSQLAWLATHGSGWLVRRSFDLVPQLVRLAIAEWRIPAEGGQLG